MASCATCGTTILFGGKRLGDLRFCSDKCVVQGQYLAVAAQVPESAAMELAGRIHAGLCPRCKGPGPVDVYKSFSIWSAILLTSWKTQQHICCRACGSKAQYQALLQSAVAGWWGFPWGFLITPVQIARNIGGLRREQSLGGPSPDLVRVMRLELARQAVAPQGPPK